MSIPRTFISRLQARKASIFTPTLPHGTIKCRNITQTPLTGAASPRPISHAFDPATPPPPPTATPPFTFLHPNNLTTPEYQHTITIIPPNLKVPWPTSLPCALQSRYWREADHAATDYLHTIFSSQPNTQTKEKYIATVSEAAVSYAINLIPLGNPARTKLLTRTFVLAFLHDDAVDKGNTDKNSHLMVPNTSSQSHTTGNEISNHTAFNILRREILAENPTQGEILLRDILSWGCVYQHQKKPITFDSLEEYFLPALEDFGAGLILRTVEFSLNLPSFSSEERGELKVLKDLCARHMLLTNDLYSYAKEVVAEERGGERVFSAVRVVEQVMGVSDTSAKAILRVVIRDLEGRMDEEYVRLQGMEGVSEPQLRYARAMIVAVAGNMLFSATCSRYARVVEGSELM